jgi:electron transfer flavoprotein alpha subunit
MRTLILAEHNGKALSRSVFQSVTAAQFWEAPIDILIAGNNISVVAEQAALISGVSRVIQAEAKHLNHQLAEDVAELVATLGPEYRFILAADSPFSRNILPRAAALLDVEMISDVLEIKSDNIYVRSIYSGSVNATVQSNDVIQVLTIHSSHYVAANSTNDKVENIKLAVQVTQNHSRWISETRFESARPALNLANVVVSGGGSLGSADGFDDLLSPLADKLGAALGATRAAIEAGYASSDMLVGQSGTVVAPDLYIAVGISGAVQHTHGIKDSKVIVAINQDPDAPIYQVADYWLVGDLFQVVPELTANIQTLN